MFRDRVLIISCLIFARPVVAWGQAFNSGSDGSDGAIIVAASQTLNFDLTAHPDGVINATSVTIEPGGTLRFIRNPLNTPVYLLCQGDVTLRGGQIDIGGGTGTTNPPIGGSGGPGGFDGGQPGTGPIIGGAGHGPGAGAPATAQNVGGRAGSAAHATRRSNTPAASDGDAYGSQLLQPLIGGSGGGAGAGSGDANQGYGGGGGGGAILIASNTKIELNQMQSQALLDATGGNGTNFAGAGSGGAIRLVAPRVAGNGLIDVTGGVETSIGHRAGGGRIRIDTIDRRGLTITLGGGQVTVGSFMVARIPNLPRLDVVEVAEMMIPLGHPSPFGPILLPFGSTNMRTVKIRASGFTGTVMTQLLLTPESGSAIKMTVPIDMTQGDPAVVTVPVTLPTNTLVHVNAWTQ